MCHCNAPNDERRELFPRKISFALLSILCSRGYLVNLSLSPSPFSPLYFAGRTQDSLGKKIGLRHMRNAHLQRSNPLCNSAFWVSKRRGDISINQANRCCQEGREREAKRSRKKEETAFSTLSSFFFSYWLVTLIPGGGGRGSRCIPNRGMQQEWRRCNLPSSLPSLHFSSLSLIKMAGMHCCSLALTFHPGAKIRKSEGNGEQRVAPTCKHCMRVFNLKIYNLHF